MGKTVIFNAGTSIQYCPVLLFVFANTALILDPSLNSIVDASNVMLSGRLSSMVFRSLYRSETFSQKQVHIQNNNVATCAFRRQSQNLLELYDHKLIYRVGSDLRNKIIQICFIKKSYNMITATTIHLLNLTIKPLQRATYTSCQCNIPLLLKQVFNVPQKRGKMFSPCWQHRQKAKRWSASNKWSSPKQYDSMFFPKILYVLLLPYYSKIVF